MGIRDRDDDVDGFIYMHNLQRPVHMYGTKTLCEIYHAGCCMLHLSLIHIYHAYGLSRKFRIGIGLFKGRGISAADGDIGNFRKRVPSIETLARECF